MKIKTYNVIETDSHRDSQSCYAFDNKMKALELFKEKVKFWIENESGEYDENEMNDIMKDEHFENNEEGLFFNVIESE